MECRARLQESTITRRQKSRAAIAAVLLTAAVASLAAAATPASAALLLPPGHKVYFGVSDTGDPGQFGEFSTAVRHHSPVIESFRPWGGAMRGSLERWQTARARPMVHITTADGNDGHELITPRQIALGDGDGYLVRLNNLFWRKKVRAYIRPLGEPNRCLNVYASYDCEGNPIAGHAPRWYRLAFRRIYVIVHGGGKKGRIDHLLAEAGLPPLNADVTGLPRAPVAVVWSPLPSGSPGTPRNLPAHFYPGARWVDWIGTDFYASYAEWKALNRIYELAPHKPFAITEWGIEAGDDPAFVRKLFTWVKRHQRCRMLVYYQDFGSSSPYRIQNYPSSLSVLAGQLHSRLFPSFAKGAPHAPPPPPGGVSAR